MVSYCSERDGWALRSTRHVFLYDLRGWMHRGAWQRKRTDVHFTITFCHSFVWVFRLDGWIMWEARNGAISRWRQLSEGKGGHNQFRIS
jgi:hypothetical protein